MKKKYPFFFTSFLFFFLISHQSFSQTPNGPGGISNTSGSGSLRLWLDAGDLNADGNYTNNPANGTAVSVWDDKSGYGYNLSNGTTAQQPNYNTTGTYKAVQFSTPSSGTAIKNLSNASSVTLAPGSIFLVVNTSDAGNASNSFFDDGNISLRLEQYNNTNEVGYTRYGTADYTSGIATPYSTSAYSIISYHKSASSSNVIINVGASTATVAVGSNSVGIPIERIGVTGTGPDRANYNLVEVIAHNVVVNTAQRVIIENELSAKYGNIPLPLDVYTMDNVASGNYDYDVAGVGQASDGSQQLDSRGTGIIEVNNPGGLGNNRYLIWGDDNGFLGANNITDVPAVSPNPVQARFSRTWRASNTGITSEDMSFDLAGLGTVIASDLRLLIDKNGSGTFVDETVAGGGVKSGFTHVSGTIYKITGIDILDGERFTIGTINKSQTPLPIELTKFTAAVCDKNVCIDWSTATETNNDYFTVEKTQDGSAFETVGTVKGVGNSTTELNYSLIDNAPYDNVSYYRLKQTDFNGVFTYSNLDIVDFTKNNAFSFNVYPNPNDGSSLNINLNAEKGEEMLVVIYDATGKKNYSKVIITENEGENVYGIDPVNRLTAGIYMITVSNRDKMISKKLIVK